ncbi:glutathione S-transferase family protein [Psychrobacter sp. HD31]|uniref:glutathione S-transferase family protein n=1 Tax=Psychrobacter sp. HD31 TaxID=3112003 RepID=UPI003DA66C31
MKKLYINQYAPNPRKPILLMQAKGLDIYNLDDLQIIEVDFAKDEQSTDEFARINPLKLVPVLTLEDGTIINDSQAICEYLDKTYGQTSLMGQGAVHRAKVCAMRRAAELEVLYPYMLAFQHGHPSKAHRVEQVAEFVPKSIKRAVDALPYFEAILKDHDYLVDNALSFADIVLYLALDFGRVHKVKPTEQSDGVARFYSRMNEKFGMKKP